MKKSLVLSLALCATMGVNAETFEYDFDTAPEFFPYLQAPIEELGMGVQTNFDFIKKDGSCVLDGCPTEDKLMDKNEAGEFVTSNVRFRISLADGCCYTLGEDGKYKYEGEEPDYTQPFIAWEDGGPTRVVWLYGINKTEEWIDDNYSAINADNWIKSRHGIQFSRNDHSASRSHTYIQFPAFAGPYTMTYYICATSDSNRNKEQALKCKVVPVVNDVVNEEAAQITEEPYGNVPDKRFIKKSYEYSGSEPAALRICANGAQLVLVHATISTDATGIADVIATAEADENAPVYNVLGQRVNENYKGLVIKNGVKYIQK
ncbi:MAG: hypothetical protein NC039_08790 [Muribaculaceae bacterium]|nr:hypothetical protein [Muribaculaceae bacterium]